MDFTLILAAVIAFGVLMYVILDGFDLGVGILFPFMPGDSARQVAINSIAPVWDGNETWLVLGGAVLFAAFPAAYAITLNAFYIPIMLLLFALIFRGVAFEFRQKARRTRWLWDSAFAGGSTLAAFCQGVILGALLDGVAVTDGAYSGGILDWLEPFSLLTGLGVVGSYALLGSTWLNIKATGELHVFAKSATKKALLITIFAIAVVSIYTPLKFPYIAQRWFSGTHLLALSPVPLATLVVTVSLWREISRDAHLAPFLYAIALFMLGYLGIGISLWPYLVPPSLTVWDAAAPRASQEFLLVALALTVPMILLYTGYAYYVFRGKTLEDDGYH